MAILLSIVALLLAVSAGAYLIYSVERGRPWALEVIRAVGEIPAPVPSRIHPNSAVETETEIEEEVDEPALAA
jgi:hypothetical protein